MKINARVFCIAVCILLAISQRIYPQVKIDGIVRGVVSDGETGEAIAGVNITVEGTKRGAATDLNGNYSISLPSGTYTLYVSALSYQKKRITEINIEPGVELKLFIVLQSAAIESGEVTIEAKANTSYEASVLTRQKNAAAISDGLSAEQIKKAPDATTGDAIRRMTGVTLVDNKFIFIRGTTERYNQTTLNGTTVASTDPDRKSFSYDMLPSNLIDNTVITKSATPDLRGDFSGGIVQLTTLDFPDKFQLKVGYGTSRNTVTTGKEFLGQQQGKSDWLGIDDGTRNHELPPFFKGDLTAFLKSLPNTWGTRKISAPLPSIFFLSLGNAVSLNSSDNAPQIGYIGSFSYRNSYQHNDFFRSVPLFQRSFNGPIDNYSVLWAALANISFRYNPLHTISFKNNYTHSADQEIRKLNSDDVLNNTNLMFNISKWTQRSIYSGQLTGEHQFPALNNLHLEWHAAVSSGDQQIPDRKEMDYYRSLTPDPYDPAQARYTAGRGRRSWSVLHDRNISYSADISVPLSIVKLKTGVLFEKKKTDFTIRAFTMAFDWRNAGRFGHEDVPYLPLDSVFAPENIGDGFDGLWYAEGGRESSKPTDSYWGNSVLSAGYLMADIPLTLLNQKFRLIGGWRIENYSLDISYSTDPTTPLSRKETVLKHNIDYLPSVNVTYQMFENANVRFAFSKTLNRPEFRELSRTDIYDYDLNVYETGNSGLERATILNYDIRFEMFPSSGEITALSFFKKDMKNVSEVAMFFNPSQVRTWIKSPHAECTGWELELRKNFGFIYSYLSNLSASVNYSRIFSAVDYKIVADASEFQKRPLQGQSPYVINITLTFTEPSIGTSLSILYNRFGERVDAVGGVYDNKVLLNIYEQPRDLVDLTLTQPLLWGLEAKAGIKNLNGKDRILLIDNEIGYYIFQKTLYEQKHTGSTYSFQISKSF